MVGLARSYVHGATNTPLLGDTIGESFDLQHRGPHQGHGDSWWREHPREVEEFLYRHPMILDVQVIGVPDEKYGEELCALVRLRPNTTMPGDEVRAFCEGQIAHYRIPRYVKFVEGFPPRAGHEAIRCPLSAPGEAGRERPPAGDGQSSPDASKARVTAFYPSITMNAAMSQGTLTAVRTLQPRRPFHRRGPASSCREHRTQ
jgi:hypothetical protein